MTNPDFEQFTTQLSLLDPRDAERIAEQLASMTPELERLNRDRSLLNRFGEDHPLGTAAVWIHDQHVEAAVRQQDGWTCNGNGVEWLDVCRWMGEAVSARISAPSDEQASAPESEKKPAAKKAAAKKAAAKKAEPAQQPVKAAEPGIAPAEMSTYERIKAAEQAEQDRKAAEQAPVVEPEAVQQPQPVQQPQTVQPVQQPETVETVQPVQQPQPVPYQPETVETVDLSGFATFDGEEY